MKQLLTIAGLLLFALPSPSARQTSPTDATAAFKDDVHAGAGLTCVACHTNQAGGGGTYQSPPRTGIAPLCARCHGDAAYMRRFDPQVRVDKFLQYQTSTHGKRMAPGRARRHVHRLSWRPWGEETGRRAVARRAAQHHHHLRAVSRRRRANDNLRTQRRSSGRLVGQCACGGAPEARRHIGADLRDVPW